MNEKNIIKNIGALKAIKLDENWKNNNKSRLFLLLEENHEQSTQSWLARAFDLRILFQPIPRGVLAGVLVIFAFGTFLFNFLISRESIYNSPDPILVIYNKDNNKEIGHAYRQAMPTGRQAGKIELGNKENNREIINNKEISPFSRLVNKESNVIADNNKENKISSYTSLNNKEDYLVIFRINLNERINRVWALSYESGNDEVFRIVKEAEKLFNDKDYDAALRAVMVAESMLD